jgi:hypothetical protein
MENDEEKWKNMADHSAIPRHLEMKTNKFSRKNKEGNPKKATLKKTFTFRRVNGESNSRNTSMRANDLKLHLPVLEYKALISRRWGTLIFG